MNRKEVLGWRCLVASTVGLMLFGLMLVVLPDLTRQMFSLLMYGAASHLNSLAPEAVAYIGLVHAVLGAVLFGWGALMLGLVLGPIRKGFRHAWFVVVISLLSWFIPDTAYSLWSGFWQNAVLNLGFATMFALPLWAVHSCLGRAPT